MQNIDSNFERLPRKLTPMQQYLADCVQLDHSYYNSNLIERMVDYNAATNRDHRPAANGYNERDSRFAGMAATGYNEMDRNFFGPVATGYQKRDHFSVSPVATGYHEVDGRFTGVAAPGYDEKGVDGWLSSTSSDDSEDGHQSHSSVSRHFVQAQSIKTDQLPLEVER